MIRNNRLGLLHAPILNKIKTMPKVKNGDFHLYATKGLQYGFKVQPNGKVMVVNFTKGNKVLFTGVDPNTIFNKRRNKASKNYIKNSLSRIHVNKVNSKNKRDPISLDDFRSGEYAYKVKSGGPVAYYRTNTIHKLAGVTSRTAFDMISGNKRIFNNPLLGYNNRGKKFPVLRRNVTRVRMVAPHKVK